MYLPANDNKLEAENSALCSIIDLNTYKLSDTKRSFNIAIGLLIAGTICIPLGLAIASFSSADYIVVILLSIIFFIASFICFSLDFFLGRDLVKASEKLITFVKNTAIKKYDPNHTFDSSKDQATLSITHSVELSHFSFFPRKLNEVAVLPHSVPYGIENVEIKIINGLDFASNFFEGEATTKEVMDSIADYSMTRMKDIEVIENQTAPENCAERRKHLKATKIVKYILKLRAAQKKLGDDSITKFNPNIVIVHR